MDNDHDLYTAIYKDLHSYELFAGSSVLTAEFSWAPRV